MQRRIKSGKIKNRKIYGTSNNRKIKKKRKYNEAVQNIENHLIYREVDNVVPLIVQAAVIKKASKRAKLVSCVKMKTACS